MSSERVLSQSSTALTNVTGVAIDYAAGNTVGAGTLNYVEATDSLTWTAQGDTAGVTVPVTTDGKYTIKSGTAGFLLVTVTHASLPGSNQNDSVTIANISNETFDDVAKAESFAGDTNYRCFYITNTHATDPFLDTIPIILTQPSVGVLSLGADPAGVGDGVTRSVSSITRSGSVATVTTAAAHGYASDQSVAISGAVETQYNGTFTITVTGTDTFTYAVTGTPTTPATGTILAKRGVAVTIADEATAPAGVTFSEPPTEQESIDDELNSGTLEPGECRAYWERRVIPARNTVTGSAVSQVSHQAYY
jgi:hypothetical protein